MSDEKKASPTSSPATRKKRPTLTERNKKQAEEIKALTTQLKEKEKALEEATQQAELVDQLNLKLDEMKKRAKTATKKIKDGKSTIDTLEQKISENVQEAEIELAASSTQNNHTSAQNTVKMHMIAGMTLGLLPAPLFDIAALSGTQLNLLRSLSVHYDVDFDEQLGKTIVTSLVSGSLPVLTVVGLSSFMKVIPGIGTVGGGIGMTVMAGAVISATGQVFIRHFEAGGTIESFDSKQWQTYFKEQVEEAKVAIKRQTDKLQSPAADDATAEKATQAA